MSTVVNKLLLALLLLCILVQGRGEECNLSSIEVQQTNVGQVRGFDTTFEVEVKNLCSCMVTQVVLNCQGFASSVSIDPKLFRQVGDADYLVNSGNGIPSLSSIKFRYSWDHFFGMAPASFKASC